MISVKGNRILDEKMRLQENYERVSQYYALTIDWIRMVQRKKSIKDYLDKWNYKKVCIYGLSDVGYRLYDELKDSGIEIVCMIDKNAFGKFEDTDIMNLSQPIPECDLIIVTPVYYINEIEIDLRDKVLCPIVALDDLIAEINMS